MRGRSSTDSIPVNRLYDGTMYRPRPPYRACTTPYTRTRQAGMLTRPPPALVAGMHVTFPLTAASVTKLTTYLASGHHLHFKCVAGGMQGWGRVRKPST